jgi:hypothetical protein
MKKLILVFALFLTFSSQTKAQGLSTDGKDFYLGFLYPSFNRVIPAFSAGFFRVYAIISSYQDNTAYVSYFSENGTEENAIPYKIQARKAVQVPLNVSKLRMTDPGDQVKEYKSVHITSKKPITVQFFITGGCSGGMYQALPTTLLGKKYVIASYNDNPDGELSLLGGRGPSEIDVACGYFQVIGTENGTTVTITPTSTTQGGKHTGVTNGPGATGTPSPYTVSLNRGQCYMVKSHCSSKSNDITGSTIESDKPVAVISGHENAWIGSVGTYSVEGRDYMVEQMIPVAHWDNTGYVSIPYVDSDPRNSNGAGDNYRVIIYDSSDVTANVAMARIGKATEGMNVAKYQHATKYAIEEPVDFSTGTVPFMVYQIDQANHSTKQPYPRPSMSQIIPISRWKNAYLWSVPSNVDERLQAYYINVIGPKAASQFDSIYVSKNGQKDVPLRQAGLTQVAQFTDIPNHPELKAIRYKVTPGSYYMRGHFPFMVYHYGNRAIDADGDLGDLDNDDNFFSYALSLGYQYKPSDSGNISITIDTLCQGWRICVNDMTTGGDILSASLLDDPYGDIYPFDEKVRGPYKYYNSVLDPTLDPDNTRDIMFNGIDSSVCFNVKVENPSKDAYAPIMIADAKCHTRIIELTFKKTAIEITPDPLTGGSYGLRMVGTNTDSVFTFVNLPGSSRDYLVTEVSLVGSDSSLKILSVTPVLPALIKPGDTLKYKVRFSSQDTVSHFDTIRLVTDCSTTLVPVAGEGGCGIIVASDHDFGNVVVTSTACTDTLAISNIGKLPFTLTSDFLLQDKSIFSLDTTRVRVGNRDYPLPIVIQPNSAVRMYVCYTPSDDKGVDSTAIIWGTDIPSPYTLSRKSFSILRGKGIKPGVQWDVSTANMKLDSTQTTYMRRWLINKSTAQIVVNQIWIDGPDAPEFKITGMQNPLPIAIDTGSTVWVDVSVTADLSKPAGLIRTARLVATNTFDVKDSVIVLIRAGYDLLKVAGDLPLEAFTIIPNPSSGGNMVVNFGLEKQAELSFVIFDMLGREVISIPAAYFTKGKQSLSLPVSKLGEGGYILRVSDGVLTRSISFRVVK